MVNIFPNNMDYFHKLPMRERNLMMLEFIDNASTKEIERLGGALMPTEFCELYVKHRMSFPQRESFKKTWIQILDHQFDGREVKFVRSSGVLDKLESAILRYIQHTGSFTLTDLPTVLSRRPTEQEQAEAAVFVASLTDAKLKKLFRGKRSPVEG